MASASASVFLLAYIDDDDDDDDVLTWNTVDSLPLHKHELGPPNPFIYMPQTDSQLPQCMAQGYTCTISHLFFHSFPCFFSTNDVVIIELSKERKHNA